jgi:hypothetical protein
VKVAGNQIATLYADNVITMSAGVAANQINQTYTVTFQGGPAVWNACNQATIAGDGLVITVLRADNSILKSFTYLPAVWAGTQALAPAGFTYTGDGTGAVRLRVETNIPGTARFGGAIDDIKIYGP